MRTKESFRDLYHHKFDWLPDNIKKEIGHFNIDRLDSHVEGDPTSIPFKKRDFYKIMLIKGKSRVRFAERKVSIKKQALTFLSPQIPNRWECLDGHREGTYCIFTPRFFRNHYQFDQYEVFQLNGKHVFELNIEQYGHVLDIFNRLEKEYESDYKYKYDLIRNLILELVHFGLKIEPSTAEDRLPMNASQRISVLFLNLLEQQFQIDNSNDIIALRSPSEFAERLNIHVNHLNRSIKETLGKPTSQIIKERILQESKILLKNTSWNVSDIAYSLGFTEATHFNNFFKKNVEMNPLKFRSN